jgi:hypothetical protein
MTRETVLRCWHPTLRKLAGEWVGTLPPGDVAVGLGNLPPGSVAVGHTLPTAKLQNWLQSLLAPPTARAYGGSLAKPTASGSGGREHPTDSQTAKLVTESFGTPYRQGLWR